MKAWDGVGAAVAAALLVGTAGESAALQDPPAGIVSGQVLEAGTRRLLSGARVSVEGIGRTTVTDSAGAFRIAGIPPGTYALRAELLAYAPGVWTDVVIRPGRITRVDLELRAAAIVLQGIEVGPDYFRSRPEAPVATVTFAAEEIRRAPGSAGDVSRIMYGLPAVAKVNDQSNGLAVRGGTAAENLFLVDNMPVPNINHFPSQGATSGPIGLLHVDLIRDVEFHAGAFPAQYGDRLSAVVEIALREGNRDELDAQLDLNFTGFGGVFEGPLTARGSWLVAARRSYLDLVVKALNVGATVAPRFGDYHAKVTRELSPRHELALLALWSDDHFVTDLEQANENGMTTFGRQAIVQGTTGMDWTALWSDRLLSRTSLSHTWSRFHEDYTETASRASLFRNRSGESTLTLRHATRVQLDDGVHSQGGFEVAATWAGYDNDYARHVTPLGDTVPALQLRAAPAAERLSAFGEVTMRPLARLTATFGARVEHRTLTAHTALLPRLSLTVAMSERTALTGAAGVYAQSLPLVLLAHEPHRALREPQAYHLVLGVSHLIAPDTRLTLETYHKQYHRLPLDPQQPALLPLDELQYANGFFTVREQLRDVGRARASGVEGLLQKKLSGRTYGMLGAAYVRARYRDLAGVWRDRVFDNRLSLSAEGGYRIGAAWELSGRWIYASGAPYTPLDSAVSAQLNRTVLDDTRINAARFPAYHSLNLRVDRRFHFARSSLIVYLSAWNAYDRRNIASYYWDTVARRIAATHQWRILPIFGIEYEL